MEIRLQTMPHACSIRGLKRVLANPSAQLSWPQGVSKDDNAQSHCARVVIEWSHHLQSLCRVSQWGLRSHPCIAGLWDFCSESHTNVRSHHTWCHYTPPHTRTKPSPVPPCSTIQQSIKRSFISLNNYLLPSLKSKQNLNSSVKRMCVTVQYSRSKSLGKFKAVMTMTCGETWMSSRFSTRKTRIM